MAKLSIITIGTALFRLAQAIGEARVVNNCEFSVTTWSVGSDISGPYTLEPGTEYSEKFTVDSLTGGRALKTTIDPDGLHTGDAQTIYAYNLDGSTIWYDLSDVFGDAFAGHKLVLASEDKNCPSIVWEDGIPPAGSQVKNCGAGADVTLTLCA